MMADKGTCRSCGAEILWIETPKGKATPVDAAHKMVWCLDAETETWMLKRGHESHFATCPNAAEHRKGG